MLEILYWKQQNKNNNQVMQANQKSNKVNQN